MMTNSTNEKIQKICMSVRLPSNILFPNRESCSLLNNHDRHDRHLSKQNVSSSLQLNPKKVTVMMTLDKWIETDLAVWILIESIAETFCTELWRVGCCFLAFSLRLQLPRDCYCTTVSCGSHPEGIAPSQTAINHSTDQPIVKDLIFLMSNLTKTWMILHKTFIYTIYIQLRIAAVEKCLFLTHTSFFSKTISQTFILLNLCV